LKQLISSINPASGVSRRPSKTARATVVDEAAPLPVPVWKRSIDLAVSAAGLVAVFPLVYLPLALYIKIVSPRGPVLFKQERVGRGGRIFTCFKFRTMHPGNNGTVHAAHVGSLIEADIPMEKLDNYAAIIPFGKILRKTCIDELPQLFNVLRGDMSIVGPRPCVPYEQAKYLPWHNRRFRVLPGLTGLWQVSGKNRLTFDQMMRLDVGYTERMTLGRDLVIIARTPLAILQQVRDMLKKKTIPWRPESVSQTAFVVTAEPVRNNKRSVTVAR
jgi:lipopolysaccharide/colanic/teichoic acid biosynthesis glycosyltransferase